MSTQLSTQEILLIVNTILTVLAPILTTFVVKIRKSKCFGRFCYCDVERDAEDSPLIVKKKNALSSSDTSINIPKPTTPLVKAKAIH